jgi:CDP-diglyceride synthetase
LQDLESQRADMNRIDAGKARTRIRPNKTLGGLLGLVIFTWLVLMWVPRLCLLVMDPAKLETAQTPKWMLLLSITLVIISLALLKSTLALLKEVLIKTV